MAQLSQEEQKALDDLIAKRDAPEPTGGGRSEAVEVYIDLSDESAVQRGLDFGYITKADIEQHGGENGDGGDGGEGDAGKKKAPTPRRGGYFPEGEE